MGQVTLKAEKRSHGGLGKLRCEGKIPGVMYGKDIDATPIAVDAKEFLKILKTRGETTLLDLELEGKKHTVLTKEIQRDTMKNVLVHVDFQKVSMTQKIEFNLPLVLKGDSEGVKMGGVLQFQKREVTAQALTQDIIENLEVDISNLKIGDTLKVSDLQIDPKITILDDPEEVVVSVIAPKLAEDVEVPTGEEEPEVLPKGKKEEE